VSIPHATAVSFPPRGGALDRLPAGADRRIVHRAFANAQTANLVFLWVYMTGGQWGKALHYVPPLFAFALGVIMASCLRKYAPLPRRSAS
jgi:hypothetical protein